MSGIGEAFLALKNVVLLHERVQELQKDLEGLSKEQRELSTAVGDIGQRLARLEGFVEGAVAAGRPPQPPRIA